MLKRIGWFSIWMMLLAGCSGGAVVFAPTPMPAGLVSALYTHPSGTFTLSAPSTWSVFEMNTTVLSSASFSAPNADEPALLFAVIRLPQPLDSSAFAQLIDRYQSTIRPDTSMYVEQSREALGDGSWRFTGIRHVSGSVTQPVNTFILYSGDYVGVVEALLPSDPAQIEQYTRIINSFQIIPSDTLQPSNEATLAFAKTMELGLLHVAHWQTADGIFYITGEVANYSAQTLLSIPVSVSLNSLDGQGIGGATDVTMGWGIPPGGFAPFSLRFGEGQPAAASQFRITLGGDEWPAESGEVVGTDRLDWTDEFSFEAGQLIVRGTVQNISDVPVNDVRATLTVFDNAQNVIGAGFIDVNPPTLAPQAAGEYQIILNDLGGTPANYILNVQGLP